jgi:hypothetical protein
MKLELLVFKGIETVLCPTSCSAETLSRIEIKEKY